MQVIRVVRLRVKSLLDSPTFFHKFKKGIKCFQPLQTPFSCIILVVMSYHGGSKSQG